MINLRESLAEWTDFDYAMYELGVALCIFPIDSKMNDYKGVFWSQNKLGNGLLKIFDQLIELGYVEYRDEPESQYRWKS